MERYKKIGLSHEMGLIDTPPPRPYPFNFHTKHKVTFYSPSWLLYSQSGPRFTVAPVKIPRDLILLLIDLLDTVSL